MNMLTDDEGQRDLGYVIWFAGVVVFLGLAIINHARFDAQGFGIGFGAVLSAGGLMSWLRKKDP